MITVVHRDYNEIRLDTLSYEIPVTSTNVNKFGACYKEVPIIGDWTMNEDLLLDKNTGFRLVRNVI